MSKIIIPANNISQPQNTSHLIPSLSLSWFNSQWSETLIAQHSDLDDEIKSANELLNKSRCSLIQLDVRLKRLTKGVLTHLELEANFLTPMLAVSKASSGQKKYLNKSFDALFVTCQATMEYIHSLKLDAANSFISVIQKDRVIYFLDEIKKRLTDEDVIYSQLTGKKGVTDEV